MKLSENFRTRPCPLEGKVPTLDKLIESKKLQESDKKLLESIQEQLGDNQIITDVILRLINSELSAVNEYNQSIAILKEEPESEVNTKIIEMLEHISKEEKEHTEELYSLLKLMYNFDGEIETPMDSEEGEEEFPEAPLPEEDNEDLEDVEEPVEENQSIKEELVNIKNGTDIYNLLVNHMETMDPDDPLYKQIEDIYQLFVEEQAYTEEQVRTIAQDLPVEELDALVELINQLPDFENEENKKLKILADLINLRTLPMNSKEAEISINDLIQKLEMDIEETTYVEPDEDEDEQY